MNGIKRRLSFSKRVRRSDAGPETDAAPPAPTVTEQLKAKGSSIRRNLSFKRSPRVAKEAPEPAASAAKPAEAPATIGSPISNATRSASVTSPSAAISIAGANIRRTFSWQRAHRQSKHAQAASDDAGRGKGFDAAAPTLLALLDPRTRAAVAQTCKAMRAVASTIASRGPPPPRMPHAAHTHEGGTGGLGKENQDTYFVIHPSPELSVYAVFDGHGKRFGRLAAQVASKRVAKLLGGWHKWVLDAPEAAMRLAFADAHASIRRAMMAADPSIRSVAGRDAGAAGSYLLQWVEEEAEEAGAEPTGFWDAVDGGTTATVVAIIRGELAVIGIVGDSSVLLLGRHGESFDLEPGPQKPALHRVLVDEHSPPNLPEYKRISALPGTESVRFVYDCPDFEEFNIFERDANGVAILSTEGLRLADEHQCMHKNSREDRFTLLAIPEMPVELPAMPSLGGRRGAAQTAMIEEQAITMTRSLGDFYAHHHGVSWEPEVKTLPLRAIDASVHASPHLYLASDGVWDLWEFDEVAEALVPPSQQGAAGQAGAQQVERLAAALIESTRARSNDYYGESADNLTGVLVRLELPPPRPARSAAPAAPAAARALWGDGASPSQALDVDQALDVSDANPPANATLARAPVAAAKPPAVAAPPVAAPPVAAPPVATPPVAAAPVAVAPVAAPPIAAPPVAAAPPVVSAPVPAAPVAAPPVAAPVAVAPPVAAPPPVVAPPPVIADPVAAPAAGEGAATKVRSPVLNVPVNKVRAVAAASQAGSTPIRLPRAPAPASATPMLSRDDPETPRQGSVADLMRRFESPKDAPTYL